VSERIEFIEIDLNICQNSYGIAPCTAQVGVTGTEKCFNCVSTCQDLANYSQEGPVNYEWDSSAELADWNFARYDATVNNGILSLDGNATDPQMVRGATEGLAAFDGAAFDTVEIKWKRDSAAGNEFMNWGTQTNNNYSAARAVQWNATGIVGGTAGVTGSTVGPDSNGFYTTTIDLSGVTEWAGGEGLVTRIRFDLFGNDANALGQVDFLKVKSKKQNTVRYSIPTSTLPLDIDSIPNVAGINFSPATLELGKGLGIRSSLSVI